MLYGKAGGRTRFLRKAGMHITGLLDLLETLETFHYNGNDLDYLHHGGFHP